MARRFTTQKIKANKPYKVDELADAASVSTPTVRNWIKDGMHRVDGNRPTIIMGFQAQAYLNARKTKTKRPLGIDEFYCMRCKSPRKPFGSIADYVPTSATGGRLKALCEVCECQCNRNVSAGDLPAIRKVLNVEIRGSW